MSTVGLTSLYEDLAKTNRSPQTQILSFAVEPASGALAVELGIEEGTDFYVIERLWYAEGEPLALMRNHVPAGLLRLSADDLEAHGLYELLRAAGINLKIAKQSIGARIATAAEARVLGEARRAPVLTMTRSAYDDQGRAVEHGNHIYRASRYSFDITLTWLVKRQKPIAVGSRA